MLGLSFGVVVLAYVFIMFVLMPANRFFVYPSHYDDYRTLARTLPLRIRPISVLVADGLSYSGERGFFLYVDLMTVVDAYLALLFVSLFLKKKITIVRTIVFSLFLLSLPVFADADKQTGTFVSVTAAFFGLLTLFALWGIFERNKRWLITVGAASYALSVFCKEDYILPVLIVSVFYAMSTWSRPAMRRWSVATVGSFVSVVLAYEYYSQKLFPVPFISGALDPSHPYYINTSLRSVWRTFVRYTHLTFPSLLLAILVVVALLYAVCLDRRPRMYVLLLVIGSLFAPYSVLPNHVFLLYGINWAPWIVAAIVDLELPASLRHRLPRFSWWQTRGSVVLRGSFACALALIPVFQMQDSRATDVHYYLSESSYNHTIMQSLFAIKDHINTAKIVGVKGVRGFNPFMIDADITYLRQHGLQSHWVLFLEPDDPLLFFYTDKTYTNLLAADEQHAVQNDLTYARATDVGQFPGALLLEFDPSGKLAHESRVTPDFYPKHLQFAGDDSATSAMQDRAVISGVYPNPGSPWRWTANQWQMMLHTTETTHTFTMTFVVPDYPVFRTTPQGITVSFGAGAPQSRCCFDPGEHEIVFDLPPDVARKQGNVLVNGTIATTFSPVSIGIGTDTSELGVLLVSAGFD